MRDGLKPVHRRVLYAMYDGGYRPDRGYFKCARVVGDVMGNYHPHGDSAIYDALVRLAQPWSLRYPLVDGNGNFGSPGNDPAAAMRYTECRLAPLAMEMLRDIDKETVDFSPNYDGRSQEPVVLPSRFPNLLVNGSAGIAVGMATNIPPHNLREVAAGVAWFLENYEATDEELLDALIERIKGPDFPTHGLIVGRRGIEDAYRTGRGSITMRAVVEVEEIQGRTCLVVTELPVPGQPGQPRPEDRRAGQGRARSPASPTSGTRPPAGPGQRLVIVLKRDAVAKVVLNNLYKHTQLQDTFGANMLALVDGVPRTLRLDQFVRYWVDAPDRGHRPPHAASCCARPRSARTSCARLLKALDRIDEVIALIRRSPSASEAQNGLMQLLEIDEIQAQAILDMQLRKLAALERQQITDEYDELMAEIADYNDILASPERQRTIVGDELAEIVDKFGDERRTRDHRLRRRRVHRGPDRRRGRRRHDHPRRLRQAHQDRPLPGAAARRQGRTRRAAASRTTSSTTSSSRRRTTGSCSSRTRAGSTGRRPTSCPRPGATPAASTSPTCWPSSRTSSIAEVLDLRDYEVAPYLVLGHQAGPGQEDPRSTDYDSPRSGRAHRDQPARGRRGHRRPAGLARGRPAAGQQRRPGHPLPGPRRRRCGPMGRATAGVIGMRFADGEELLDMHVVREGDDVLVATEGGYAKRTPAEQYPCRVVGAREF